MGGSTFHFATLAVTGNGFIYGRFTILGCNKRSSAPPSAPHTTTVGSGALGGRSRTGVGARTPVPSRTATVYRTLGIRQT